MLLMQVSYLTSEHARSRRFRLFHPSETRAISPLFHDKRSTNAELQKEKLQELFFEALAIYILSNSHKSRVTDQGKECKGVCARMKERAKKRETEEGQGAQYPIERSVRTN
ncbi:hypothetical protein KQX54_015089 [Cotesia glomerata]|uniref:Uncharacterized protein n=1 Tax=Cotesia glomerata TaxID=32391 RepID=A0AAV7HVM2_COTGL|nr:hypothetical protein KQX54_015089 [Cotesia glomerata]